MLKDVFSKGYEWHARRYSAMPLLRFVLDEFSDFLFENGYPRDGVVRLFRPLPRIDKRLRRSGCHKLTEITRNNLRACAPPKGHSQDNYAAAATVRQLLRYLELKQIFKPEPRNPIQIKVAEYGKYLEEVHGFVPETVSFHLRTAENFLSHHCRSKKVFNPSKLTSKNIERFIRIRSRQISRATLQHTVGQLRCLVRYLASRGEAPLGIDLTIDSPRVYREEQLPRALPWKTVQELLKSIDRSQAIGLRDYAMLLIIATYGCRISEIVALKLDDIDWRATQLRISQTKTNTPLLLPLTDPVGTAILAYLKRGRPPLSYREIFVRHNAPAGILKAGAVTDVFQKWSHKSGISIPFQGAHCLRHS
jgi:integrase/recombinase XerD